jgi:hypothetical protein
VFDIAQPTRTILLDGPAEILSFGLEFRIRKSLFQDLNTALDDLLPLRFVSTSKISIRPQLVIPQRLGGLLDSVIFFCIFERSTSITGLLELALYVRKRIFEVRLLVLHTDTNPLLNELVRSLDFANQWV